MAEVGLGTALTIIKYGVGVYEFLKKISDKTVIMKCQFPTDKNDNKIIFTAYDHHSIFGKLFTSATPPWGDNEESWSKHRPKREEPKKFKIIEVIRENKEELRFFLNKYQGNSEIKQHDVIEYLKYIASRYENIDVSMTSTCIDKKRWEGVGGDGMLLWETWEEWMLTLTIQ